MADLFSKVSEILADPEASRRIREIASSLSSSDPPPSEGVSDPVSSPDPPSDSASLQSLLLGAGSHGREVALLRAVRPYLRASRAGKIDGAIRAIRMIDMLSSLR